MEGKIATVQEVKARWAYAELNSSRFASDFEAYLPQEIVARAKRREPFARIAKDDWFGLSTVLAQARPSRFVDQIHACGASHYECVHWHVSQLLNCLTLPLFGQVPFYQFMAMPPRRANETKVYKHDPRWVAVTVPYDEDFTVEEPVIVIRRQGREMLLEGYLRSILWLRNPSRPLPVWIPRYNAE